MKTFLNVILLLHSLVYVGATLRGSHEPRRRELFQHRKMEWAPEDSAISDEYIIVFDETSTADEVDGLLKRWMRTLLSTAKIVNEYNGLTMKTVVIKRVSLPILKLVLNSSVVKYVEQNQVMEPSETTSSWGLDRINQINLPLDNSFTATGTGEGVDVYIIDSGIMLDHDEFEGRARCGYNSFSNTVGTGCDDLRGHGSHVAGVVGGKTWGVAKKANLVAVKALNDDTGSGTLASVVGAVTYVCDQKIKNPDQPIVVNMSISGSGRTRSLDEEVERCNSSGVIFITSAGNSKGDSCSFSPGATAGSIAVGATKKDDSMAPFSNFGACVDIFAPGSEIQSVGITSTTATASKSGTSMASPYVAGAAALYLELNPSWTGDNVRSALKETASTGVITSLGADSENVLLNISGVGSSSGGSNNGSSGSDADVPADTGSDNTCVALLERCTSQTNCCGSWRCSSAFKVCWF
ncbi:serine protease [Fistulifera solaris]|uniref:subtilisin n=1 Tax=Fistulifera solaris TaxID=1519565 RepID=A0A1Z5K7P3_FISSO|nr:serine protease [Fistulifera solaris]|eukprot:GAX22254.1 serine protease [Fistulifera solaris]